MRDVVYCVFAHVEVNPDYAAKILMDVCATEEVAYNRVNSHKEVFPGTDFTVEHRFIEK